MTIPTTHEKLTPVAVQIVRPKLDPSVIVLRIGVLFGLAGIVSLIAGAVTGVPDWGYWESMLVIIGAYIVLPGSGMAGWSKGWESWTKESVS